MFNFHLFSVKLFNGPIDDCKCAVKYMNLSEKMCNEVRLNNIPRFKWENESYHIFLVSHFFFS